MIWLLIVLAVIPLLLMVMTAYVMVRQKSRGQPPGPRPAIEALVQIPRRRVARQFAQAEGVLVR
jgi:hypothetical protein